MARACAAAASILAVAFGLWFTTSLLRATSDESSLGAGELVLAGFVVLGIPVLVALWRTPRRPAAGLSALAYLPFVWNALMVFVVLRLAPATAAFALAEHGAYLAATRYGDTAPATRVLSAVGQRIAATARRPVNGKDDAQPPERTDRDALVVPFRPGGSSILVDVDVAGPAGRRSGRYVFDTGASYTTITTEAARAIGLDVPDDAPLLEFHTAAGKVTSPVVFLPELRIGDMRIDKLAVSVCDECASGEADGLLGLNVVRRFLIQTDYVRDRMLLLPRTADASGEDRAYDVQAMSRLELVGPPDVWLGTVHWVVRVRNLAPIPVEDVVPAVRFVDGPTLLGRPIPRIEPGASATTLVKGKVGASDASFVLELARARW